MVVLTGRITDGIGEQAVVARSCSLAVRGQAAAAGGGRGRRPTTWWNFRIYGLAAGELRDGHAWTLGFRLGASDSRVGTCRTFYPGTANQVEAHRLRVTAGGENSAVNFAIQPTRTVQVSGSVVDSVGRAAGARYRVGDARRRIDGWIEASLEC